MIQEYLFTSNKYKVDLERLAVPEKITKEIIEIENSECWTLLISVVGEGKGSGKKFLIRSIDRCVKNTSLRFLQMNVRRISIKHCIR